MGALSIRAAGPNDAETLFAIHRESATTAYVEIFPPDRYRFPDARDAGSLGARRCATMTRPC